MSPEAAQSLLALSVHLFEQARHPDCDTAARYINNRLKGLTLATADFYQHQLALCECFPPFHVRSSQMPVLSVNTRER